MRRSRGSDSGSTSRPYRNAAAERPAATLRKRNAPRRSRRAAREAHRGRVEARGRSTRHASARYRQRCRRLRRENQLSPLVWWTIAVPVSSHARSKVSQCVEPSHGWSRSVGLRSATPLKPRFALRITSRAATWGSRWQPIATKRLGATDTIPRGTNHSKLVCRQCRAPDPAHARRIDRGRLAQVDVREGCKLELAVFVVEAMHRGTKREQEPRSGFPHARSAAAHDDAFVLVAEQIIPDTFR